MDQYFPGDPANYIVGRDEEKPARVHAPQPPKPPVSPKPTATEIVGMIMDRRDELAPLVYEYERLVEADERLTRALGPVR